MEKPQIPEADITNPVPEGEVPGRNPRWLAGIFEAGATLEFRVNKYLDKGVYRYSSYPSLSLTDNDKERLDKFAGVLGGRVSPTKGGSFRWTLFGKRAVDIIHEMKTFAPSRAEFVTAVERWEQSETEERVQIGRETKGLNRFEDVTPESYTQLVESPEFVAGVLDCRGYFRYKPLVSGERKLRYILVRSKNSALIKALKNRYGSTIPDSEDEETEKDDNTWVISSDNLRKLLPTVSSHLVLKPLEEDNKTPLL